MLASVAGVAAHEMVHAIMLHSTSFAFPGWFIEGTAELIQGADERVAGAIAGGRNAGTIVAAAKSRIQDADYANATARMTRARILQEAASVMLTQANGEGRVVLALLR